mmetsp:Transcript_35004/g.46045  ORF Transcript_35004/g.46045 Transcript_35004/m.46045 type:complete len:111 (+) Transcript_35004:1025-1357(+)
MPPHFAEDLDKDLEMEERFVEDSRYAIDPFSSPFEIEEPKPHRHRHRHRHRHQQQDDVEQREANPQHSLDEPVLHHQPAPETSRTPISPPPTEKGLLAQDPSAQEKKAPR